jgi:flagellin-specific chaperone FliS
MDRANDGLGALAAYRAVAGIDAAPEEFMKMAIDAARTFMLQVEAAISDGNRPAKALGSAGKIVEFMLGLSGSEPGPLSDCLAQVYRFVLAAILHGNANDDAEPIAAGRVVLEQFSAVWRNAFPDTRHPEIAMEALN